MKPHTAIAMLGNAIIVAWFGAAMYGYFFAKPSRQADTQTQDSQLLGNSGSRPGAAAASRGRLDAPSGGPNTSPLSSPTAVLEAYFSIPTSSWRSRLPLVFNVEEALPVMEAWYDRYGTSPDVVPVTFTGDIDPEKYGRVGQSGVVTLNRQGDVSTVTVVRTRHGFKLDWLWTLRETLVEEGLWQWGEIADLSDCHEVTIEEIRAYGADLAGNDRSDAPYKSIPDKLLSCQFLGIGRWDATLLPQHQDLHGQFSGELRRATDDLYVQVKIADRNGTLALSNTFFARGSLKYKFQDIPKDAYVNLLGHVVPLRAGLGYAFEITEVEVISF